MKLLLPMLCLLVFGCSNSKGMGNDVAATAEAMPQPMQPGVRPVRIGEGGPGFKACAYTARVVDLAIDGAPFLPVRAAPFIEADELFRLPEGAPMYACTRSIDQRWQGVVVPPAEAPDTDCGVSAAVTSVRDYAGPCRSGWVASAFVRLTAN